MEGIEFDKRIEELEKLEYPKPNRSSLFDFQRFCGEASMGGPGEHSSKIHCAGDV